MLMLLCSGVARDAKAVRRGAINSSLLVVLDSMLVLFVCLVGEAITQLLE
jgi:hypothetical protein